MQEKSIRLTIIKFIYAILVFVIAVLVFSRFSEDDNADMTAQMPSATLPTITFVSNGTEISPIHGYYEEMDISHIRSTVFPIGSDRSISYRINTYGENVTDLKFEVRNISGTSLVESTQLQNYRESSDSITGSFTLKDLINADTEYMLVMQMETGYGTATYYSRIVWTEDDAKYNLDDEVAFVKEFSEATFDKEIAKDYSKYLESNSEGDNTTFSKANIHSSFSQVTWGELDISEHTEPYVYVTDIHSQTGSYILNYTVKVKEGASEKLYNVEEAYRVRYTSDRMYLLNFERTMNYVFDVNSYSISSNTIGLSITDPDMTIVESSSGSAFASVSENRLYMFNNSENKLVYLFGFYDENNDDVRTTWNNNEIKILNVDEAGNVRFAVAGYMNRGFHEGEVGVVVYDYDATINVVEEQVFVKSSFDPQIILGYVENIAYSNNNNIFYMMLDQNIYAIDLTDRTATSVVDDIGNGEYKISESMSSIAWESQDMKTLNMMDLNTRTQSMVEADDEDLIVLLGYMGEDLVYGLVHEEDVLPDQMGNPVYAMYNIKIQDGDGNILENYNPEGIYVTGVTISDNQIKMTRVTKDEESSKYVSTYDDQIMSTLKVESGSNTVSVVSVDVYEKIVQISAKSEIKVKQLRVLTPAQILFEGDRNVTIDLLRDEEEKPLYYVYGLMGIEGIYSEPAEAIQTAYDAPGTVINDYNKYVWIKGNLLKSNQIMAITRSAEAYSDMTSENSVVVCLDLILEFEGINRNVESLLDAGNSVSQILESSLTDAVILDLDGCSLSTVLYFVNMDIPVMAMLSDGTAMLVIGFNNLNTVLMNPTTGTVYKYGMNDSATLFEENGNHFITYLKGDD